MINSLTDLWVFSCHILVLDKVLLHMVDHVRSVHVAGVEVSNLVTTSIHVLAVHNTRCHHALASSSALSLHHLIVFYLSWVHLIDV